MPTTIDYPGCTPCCGGSTHLCTCQGVEIVFPASLAVRITPPSSCDLTAPINTTADFEDRGLQGAGWWVDYDGPNWSVHGRLNCVDAGQGSGCDGYFMFYFTGSTFCVISVVYQHGDRKSVV